MFDILAVRREWCYPAVMSGTDKNNGGTFKGQRDEFTALLWERHRLDNLLPNCGTFEFPVRATHPDISVYLWDFKTKHAQHSCLKSPSTAEWYCSVSALMSIHHRSILLWCTNAWSQRQMTNNYFQARFMSSHFRHTWVNGPWTSVAEQATTRVKSQAASGKE